MEFYTFTEVIKGEVERRLGADTTVMINRVSKNNGVVLCGLTIAEDDVNISPTIYLNGYYDSYENQSISITNIADKVIETYEDNKITRSIDMRFFMAYQNIQNRIIFKLVNYEMNEKILRDVPHIRYLDLAIVFQCLVSEEKYGNATILIHNAHMKLWQKTVEELYEAALFNTPKLMRYDISTMRDVIIEMYDNEDLQFDNIVDLSDSVPMYVLSNKCKIQGSACILYPNLLKDFADAIKGDFYILPSSVHESILLPAQGDEDVKALKNMVKEVNATEVKPEEILSDSVYYFCRNTGELTIA